MLHDLQRQNAVERGPQGLRDELVIAEVAAQQARFADAAHAFDTGAVGVVVVGGLLRTRGHARQQEHQAVCLRMLDSKAAVGAAERAKVSDRIVGGKEGVHLAREAGELALAELGEQGVFVSEVRVESGRRVLDAVGDAAHGQGIRTLGDDELERSVEHALAQGFFLSFFAFSDAHALDFTTDPVGGKTLDRKVNMVKRRNMNHRKPAVLAAFMALMASACAPTSPATAVPTTKTAKAPTSVATTTQALPPLQLAALTTTPQRLELGFRTGGVVQSVLVNEGARVKKGQVLARLDPTELGASVKQAEEGLERARRAADRARVLADGRAGNRSDAEDAATAVAVAEASVDAAHFARDRGVITAPVDGRVERRLADPGEVTAPGQAVLVIAQTAGSTSITARAFVDDRSLRFVDVGSVASAVVDGVNVDGVVTRVGSAAGPAGQVEVELRFDHAPRELPTGVPLRVSLACGRSALAVPALALVDGDALGHGRVRVDAAGRFVDVDVLAVADDTVFVDVIHAGGTVVVDRVFLPSL